MQIVVQKYGGTSLATPELRKRVGDLVAAAINDGYQVVVVVSAMGRQNDPMPPIPLSTWSSKSIPILPREDGLDHVLREMISGIILSNQLCARGIPACF